MIIGVAKYDASEFTPLEGASVDVQTMQDMLLQTTGGIFPTTAVTSLRDPTGEAVRDEIARYLRKRTARGDILVLHFSGHGCILPDGDFGLCMKDSVANLHGNGVIPLTAIRFSDVITSLASADVHPVIMLDACFSAAQETSQRLIERAHDDIHRHAGRAYALFCACYSNECALDFGPDGGAFTAALRKAVDEGAKELPFRRRRHLGLDHLSPAVLRELEKQGHPLSRLYVGPDLPRFDLVRNTAFRVRQERLGRHHCEVVRHLYNGGVSREVSKQDLGSTLGHTAYCNEKKLMWEPWRLVCKGSSGKVRALTSRGAAFARGELEVPEIIELDVDSKSWIAAPNSRMVFIQDVI